MQWPAVALCTPHWRSVCAPCHHSPHSPAASRHASVGKLQPGFSRKNSLCLGCRHRVAEAYRTARHSHPPTLQRMHRIPQSCMHAPVAAPAHASHLRAQRRHKASPLLHEAASTPRRQANQSLPTPTLTPAPTPARAQLTAGITVKPAEPGNAAAQVHMLARWNAGTVHLQP